MPRPRQPRPDAAALARLYREHGNLQALGSALDVSATSAAKWLAEAGIKRHRVGRPRKGVEVGQLTLHVSAVDHAGLVFRARQRALSLRATVTAIVTEALAEGRKPARGSGPPSTRVSFLLPVEVLDRLRVEADRRGTTVTALACGLALTAVPE